MATKNRLWLNKIPAGLIKGLNKVFYVPFVRDWDFQVHTYKKSMSEKKLLHRIREEIRRRNYSYSTEKAYCQWDIRHVQFHGMKHPAELNEPHAVGYVNDLSNEKNKNPLLNPGIYITVKQEGG